MQPETRVGNGSFSESRSFNTDEFGRPILHYHLPPMTSFISFSAYCSQESDSAVSQFHVTGGGVESSRV